MTASRKQFRTDLRNYLAPLITSLQAQSDCYRYEPADYKGRSPVVFLNSAGAEHPRTVTKVNESTFTVNVHILVLYADLTGGVYNEESASDMLDDVEQQIATAIEAKKRYDGKWQDLTIEGRSIADQPQQVGGDLYLHEVFTVKGKMY